MGYYQCAIGECGARLLGFNYFAVTLDNGKNYAICRPCMAKVRKLEAAAKATARGTKS